MELSKNLIITIKFLKVNFLKLFCVLKFNYIKNNLNNSFICSSINTVRTWNNIEVVPGQSFYPTELDKYYNYWDIFIEARSFLYKQVSVCLIKFLLFILKIIIFIYTLKYVFKYLYYFQIYFFMLIYNLF